MLGAIIGDIVGSRFEFHNTRTKNFELFAEDCQVTDDNIMTLAVAKMLLACDGDWNQLGQNAVKYMQKIGRKYSNCGFIARTEEEAILLSKKVTEVTHNHPEGLKGAEAVSIAIFMARNRDAKNKIKERIEKDYYNLDFTLDSIRDEYEKEWEKLTR